MRPRGSSYRGDNGECTRTRIRCHFWLAALLHQGALCEPSRYHHRCRRRFEGHNFFFKTVPDIGHP